MPKEKHSLQAGFVSAGLSGLLASISLARAGCSKVTILKPSISLGEIGAGIRMTPNMSRLLIEYGVDKIIGDDLVHCNSINMRNSECEIVQMTELYPEVVREFGFPW